MTVSTIIEQVSRLGVELLAVDNRLLARPSGVLPDDLRAALRQHRCEVVAAVAEQRRDVAADEAWERLRVSYDRAGPPVNWLTPDVRFVEHVVEQLWRSARTNAADDPRFYAALQRWEALATEAIGSVGSPAS